MTDLRTLAVACLLAAPLAAGAAGLGKQAIHSRLNQPLDMTIPLLVGADDRLEEFQVTLASAEMFDQRGIPYPGFAHELAFDIGSEEGVPSVRINSVAPIREPIVEVLVNLRWPGGNLVREYVVLLDPPEVARRAAPVEPATAVAVRLAPQPGASRPHSPGNWQVRSSETLGGIAQSVRPNADITVPQMATALFRANPEAFFGGNMNNLRNGAVLVIPDRAEVEQLTEVEAAAEMRHHYAEWRSGVSRPAPRPAAAARAEAEALPAADDAPPSVPAPVAAVEPVEPVEEVASEEASIVDLADGAAVEEARLAIVSPGDDTAVLEGELAAHVDRVMTANDSLRDQNVRLQGQLEALEKQVQNLTRQMLELPPEGARATPVAAIAPPAAAASSAAAVSPWWSSPWTVVIPSLLIALVAVAGSVLFWLRERNRGVIR